MADKKLRLGYDPENIIYYEVGDKKNYAAYYPNPNGTETFMGWISKYCVKLETVVKAEDKHPFNQFMKKDEIVTKENKAS